MKQPIKLTTPQGQIAIDASEIVALGDAKDHIEVRTHIWLRCFVEPFSVIETYDEVISLIVIDLINR